MILPDFQSWGIVNEVESSKTNAPHYMETLLILFVFAFCPLALFAFIIAGAIHRAKQHRKVWDAADKYLKS